MRNWRKRDLSLKDYELITSVINDIGYQMTPLNWDDPIAMFKGCKDPSMVRVKSVEDTIRRIKKDLRN